MTEYQNALDDMSNEAVEYIRVCRWSRPWARDDLFLQEV